MFINSASADVYHAISPHVEQRRFARIERELPPKPRSRRCFVCGTTGMHALDFRVCPRTAVLLRRSLAKINNEGRLVSFDGSPLPMTRHPGGVAAHIISRASNPLRIIRTSRESRPAPADPPRRVESPTPTFNYSSPHAVPPGESIAPVTDHIPRRRTAPSCDDVTSHARATFITVLLEALLDRTLRAQIRAIVIAVGRLHTAYPSTLRLQLRPVFEHISHFVPPT